MKKAVSILAAVLLMLTTGCTPSQPKEERLTIVATTYPVYLFVSAVVQDVDGVVVERLNTGASSCLHDYTLSVDDMKLLEQADMIAMNGVGLEDFMEDALSTSKAQVVDCSQGVALLENLTHDHAEGDEGHDHGHYDPHIWMAPENVAIMVDNLEHALSELDPDNQQKYQDNAMNADLLLETWDSNIQDILQENKALITGLITFHDGFQYFAHTYDLPLLAAIEEEAGSEASAKEISEITDLVVEKEIPVIFTEVNGSKTTAQAIQRETGCDLAQLTMLMDGPEDGDLTHYLDGMFQNIREVVNGFAGEEVIVA